MEYKKPLPKVTKEDRVFWDAARQHRFILPHCKECGHTWFPPYLNCPKCTSPSIEWINASGRGVVWSSIEMHQAYLSSFKGELPYNVALIKLAEGPFMYSNVIGAKWEELRRGTPVEVVFEDATEAIALPKFKKAAK